MFTRRTTIVPGALVALALSACSSLGGPTPTAKPTAQPPSSTTSAPAAATGAGSSTATPSASAAPVTVHIGGSGDILLHRSVWTSAARNMGGKGYDFNPMFDQVRPMISGLDVALCHQETPISPTNSDLTKPYSLVFNVPREIAPALGKAGFDGCDRVGNHVYDRGLKGIAATAATLSGAGLKNQGPTPTSAEGQTATTFDAKGVTVAHLAYGYTSLNEFASNTHTPAEAPWLKYWMFPSVRAEGIIADAKRARDAGAGLVVVSLHWGVEYSSTASAEQRELARSLLNSPEVDMILGTHVHVPQPCEKINGKYVIYGMGNFLSNQSPSVAKGLRPETQDGMVVDVALTRGSDGTFTQQMTYQPTHVRISDHQIQLATPTSNADAYRRVTKVVNSLGAQCDAKPVG